MRFNQLVGMFSGALLAAVLFGGYLPDANAAASENFGRRVAGSYVVDIDLQGALLPIQALATVAADGGVVATDTDDYGNSVAFGFHSAKHGAWARTGRREIAVSVLEYAYDTTGALTTIFVLHFLAEFDGGFQRGDGVVSFDAFLPFQDPLDPMETPVATGAGTFTLQRITAAAGFDGEGHDDEDDDD